MSYLAVGFVRGTPQPQTPEQIAKRQADAAALRAYQQTEAGKAAAAAQQAAATARRQAFLATAEGQKRVADAAERKRLADEARNQAIVDPRIPKDDVEGATKDQPPVSGGFPTKYLLIGGAALAAGWFFFMRKK